MAGIIGIRIEDKNKWEKRVPLIPAGVEQLVKKDGLKVLVQPSAIRAFSDQEYMDAQAIVQEDLSSCDAIFAVKEVPVDLLMPKKTYVFFSHVIKGQAYNMPMLKKLMDLGCNLIDYEKIVDSTGKRLIFFGRFAGIAGMIDTLWTLGQRYKAQGIVTPFADLKRTYEYESLDQAVSEVKRVGNIIREKGLAKEICPLIIGVAGYGNVAKGAGEILTALGIRDILPLDLERSMPDITNKEVIRVIFKEEDMAQPTSENKAFDLAEYFRDPSGYRGIFEKWLPNISCLVNCIYWTNKYPRLLTEAWLSENWEKSGKKLVVVGDISCDIDGAIQITKDVTTPDKPAFTWAVADKKVKEGIISDGVAVVAVDNLPCELPKDSSREFSGALMPFVSAIANLDCTQPIDRLKLPDEIKKALILYQGKLTKPFEYLTEFIEK